jgi:hypothetical protein
MTQASLSVPVRHAERGEDLRRVADGIADRRLEEVRKEICVLEEEIEVLEAMCRVWGKIEEPA